MLEITIPDNLTFADLKLNFNDDGQISFNIQVIERICNLNGLRVHHLFASGENAVLRLIVVWYAQHLAAGGKLDQTAENLMTEIKLEGKDGDRGLTTPPYSS
ncbi:hypothetical protein [Nitrosomonas sp. Nm33]|uniref:hypothetical protein n=1 Tax=Nitrosomonas sp. Nm33 TaxID=133724 RepID=UPI00089C9743|nr:hypothetical protein [Nitrosomonas sp. Nm33]SDY07161.1 hypothetical protein SAMN05421755_100663 [Nitrosomonas sp. Nm33]